MSILISTETTPTAPAPSAVPTYSVAVAYDTSLSASSDRKLFNFQCDIEGVGNGDLLIVKDRNGFSLVKAIKVYETPGPEATAWVVDKVDLSREETRKKRAELEVKLRAAIKDQELLVQARQLAGNDPKIAHLVAQLEAM